MLKSTKPDGVASKSAIYHVHFEDYLKPRSNKKRKSLLFASSAAQKSQLRLKLLEHPVLIAGGCKSKRTLLNFKKPFQFLKKLKTPSKFARANIKLPRFLTFLNARNDVVTCKRKSGFEIYCEIASIHGFNNFVGATTWQRAFWFSVVLMAVVMSGFVLLLSHLMNVDTPTLLYSESTQYPIWSMPFPAVTICNLNRISKSKAVNLAQSFQETTNITLNDLIAYFKLILSVNEDVKTDVDAYKILDKILKINNYTIVKLLDNIAPNCAKHLLRCSLYGESIECGNLFEQIQTPFGLCCSFNYNALRKLSSKRTNYAANNHVIYISNCGYITGLSVLLDPELQDYTASLTLTPGFRVLIHDAHDFPDIAAMQRIITPATSNKVSVRLHQIYATEHINSLKINSRKCYLPNERKMYHFGSYAQVNCLAECRSSMLYQKCQCILPYWPKKLNWTMCGLEDIPCYTKYKSSLMSDLKYPTSNHNDQQFICDCYPLCDVHNYNIAMDSGGLTRKYSMTEESLYKGINVSNHILLRVFSNDLHAERSRLDVYENWLSFLGTFGGITGLFMGYSILSGFELIFFVFVRPACNWWTKKLIKYRIRKRQRKAQQQEALKSPTTTTESAVTVEEKGNILTFKDQLIGILKLGRRN